MLIDIPKEEFIQKVNEGFKKSELAEYFGCSTGTIQNRARKFRVELNYGKRKIKIPKDELREYYWNKELTQLEISNIYSCFQDVIKRRMDEYNISTRSNKEAKKLVDGVDVDVEEFKDVYIGKKYSLEETADYFDCSVWKIKDVMNKNGIECRSSSQQLKTQLYKKKQSNRMSGEGNGFYGEEHTEKTKEKIAQANMGKSWEQMFDEKTLEKQREHIRNLKYWEGEERPKFSEKYSGDDHWNSGKGLDEEHKRKIRKGLAKHYKEKDGKSYPNYNPRACEIIDQYGNKYGHDFQHAENGGEFHIENVGCWLDGYDPKANVVVEVYEKHHHYRGGELCDKDKFREKLIIGELNCKLIRVSINRKGEVTKTKEVS